MKSTLLCVALCCSCFLMAANKKTGTKRAKNTDKTEEKKNKGVKERKIISNYLGDKKYWQGIRVAHVSHLKQIMECIAKLQSQLHDAPDETIFQREIDSYNATVARVLIYLRLLKELYTRDIAALEQEISDLRNTIDEAYKKAEKRKGVADARHINSLRCTIAGYEKMLAFLREELAAEWPEGM
jgi:predicted  nucleic acid-binding Zn-ribbon protein